MAACRSLECKGGFERAELHVTRKKGGKPATHPIRGDELRELRKIRKVAKGSFVFETERGGPFAVESFNHLVKKIGQKANLPFRVACAYVAPCLRL
jgi:integrase